MIDSWAWVEYFKGTKAGAGARGIIEDDEASIVSTINLAEVYRWILRFYGEAEAEEKVGVMKKRCFGGVKVFCPLFISIWRIIR